MSHLISQMPNVWAQIGSLATILESAVLPDSLERFKKLKNVNIDAYK